MPTTARSLLWKRICSLMVTRWGVENMNRLAREAGVGVATIARIKAGDTNVGVNVLEKLAAALGIETWQLLHPEDGEAQNLSALAVDLGRILDQIPDEATKRQAYAVAIQVIGFGSMLTATPHHGARPTPAPAPAL